MFPVEIWKEILKHVGTKDLVRMRIVCRTWNAVIEEILKDDKFWKKFGGNKDEVTQNVAISIMEHKLNSDLDPCQSVYLQMYKSWRGWQGIFKKTTQIKTLKPFSQHRRIQHYNITCVAALSNVIAIGSAGGYIAFYQIDIGQIFWRAKHGEYVQNVQVLRKGGVTVGVSLTNENSTKMWDLNGRHEKTSMRGSGSMITASLAHCFILRNDSMVMHLLWEKFWTDRKRRKGSDVQIRVSISVLGQRLLNDEVVATGAHGDKVFLYLNNSKLIELSWIQEPMMQQSIYTSISMLENHPLIEISCYRIFHGCIIACVGVHGEFGFSMYGEKWKIHNLIGKLRAPVTSILIHVSFLALGLQSGRVHLFPIKFCQKYLTNIDFNKLESREFILDTEAIISLNVTEHDSAQYLIAATNNQVHLIKFI